MSEIIVNDLKHVSDTALLVAAARALETKRGDRLCSDPFAAALAGARGQQMIEAMPNAYWMSFGMGLRTRFIDEGLLYEIGTRDIECVLNLGAGLDTRPWRLKLSRQLRWIEADFPHMLDYKHGVLKEQTPRCRLERVPVDLNDVSARAVLWDAIRGERSVLLLSEGLLMYLPGDTVRALAAEARKAGIAAWILDFNSRMLLKIAHGDGASKIDNLRAATHLEPEGVRTVLAENGWALIDEKRFVRDGGRYARARTERDGIAVDAAAGQVGDDDPGGVALFRTEPNQVLI